MKKIVVMLTLGLLVTGSSFAQNTTAQENKPRTEHRGHRGDKARKSPEEMATRRTEKMVQTLNLNKSQQRKLQALNLKRAQEMQAMHAKRGEATSRQSMRSEKKASKARYEAELKDILNKKQYAKYEAQREEMRARQEQKHEHRKGMRGERHQRS
ncbi:DUF4890 domain-containing protein [Pontibacter ruber]|uniref:DUF4890 domain-containing protein n=1 Tax=Pontibacter ruber TaxID=1343895 RepID=A0ABW5D2R7_9BACT|nr:DUF4890 domain-containing protein [Pontibacter ruber]